MFYTKSCFLWCCFEWQNTNFITQVLC